MNRRSAGTRLLQGLLGALLAVSAHAQGSDFPSRQVTIVVPFPPGGVTDQIARAVGQKMSDSLKVPVIVDNRPGAGAQIAANLVKQAPADGHMIFIGDLGAFALNPSLLTKPSYDIQKDFTPLARLVQAPSMVLVPASSPYNSMADLVAGGKAKAVNFASQATGSGGHMFAALFSSNAGVKVNHVPYRGSAPALTDLIGGQVDALFDPVITSGPFLKEGKLKALAIGADQRSPQFPQVPTLKELGMGNSNLVAWFAMAVKSGTPRPVVNRLSEEVIKAIKAPDVAKRFTDMGLEIAPLPAAEMPGYLDAEIARWGKVIRDAGIRLE